MKSLTIRDSLEISQWQKLSFVRNQNISQQVHQEPGRILDFHWKRPPESFRNAQLSVFRILDCSYLTLYNVCDVIILPNLFVYFTLKRAGVVQYVEEFCSGEGRGG